FMRGVLGGGVTLSAYLAFLGIASSDEYEKWRENNMGLARYLDLVTPEWILADMAANDPKQFKKYAATSLNKNDAFDASTKFLKSAEYFSKGDNSKGWGALGEALGSKLNAPIPWRLARDGKSLYQGIKGQDPYHGDYRPSEGFLIGNVQGGVIEWLGGRPLSPSEDKT